MTICRGENDVTEILPNLWLGNFKSALNIDFINEFNIKYIINITKDVPTPFPLIKYLHIPYNDIDTCGKNLNDIFDKTTELIYSALSNGTGILVHCQRGHHRSASIVAAFLIRYLNINYFDAINYVNTIRSCALRRKSCMVIALYSYYLHRLFQKDIYESNNCGCKVCSLI